MGIKLCMLILATIWVSYTEARAVRNKEVSEKATTVADSKKQELEELLAIVQYALNKESSQVQNSEYANSEFYEKLLDKISHEEVASEQGDDDSDGDNDDGLEKNDVTEKDGLSSKLADAEGEGEEGDMSDMKDKDSAEDGNAVSGPSDSDDEEEEINMQKAKKDEEEEVAKEDHAAAEDSATSVLAMEDDGLLDLNRARQQARRRSTYFDRLIRALTSLSKVEKGINRALKKICRNIG